MTAYGRIAVVLAGVVVLLGLGTPAMAYPPVEVVHTERVQAGPYAITVGFSTWPIRAMRSLDFTFAPDGGIAGRSGFMAIVPPGGRGHIQPLVRHPRERDVWGLDVASIDTAGVYAFRFSVDGPQGHGEGALRGVQVLSQPGPPLALSWTVASLPLVGLVALIVVAWRRVRPGRQPLLADGGA
jgi:hypothetical protein